MTPHRLRSLPTRAGRGRTALLALASVAALLMLVASPSQVAASDAGRDRPGQVTGRVVDAAGEPVAGAMVNVLGPTKVPEKALEEDSRFSTTTGADGTFSVPQNPQGYLVQVCEPSGDRPWSCDETVLGVDFVITYAGPAGVTDSWLLQHELFDAETSDRALGTIAVGLPSEISGRIAGASFELVQLRRMNDSVAFNMRTDGDGNYAFKGLVAGRYYVAAGGAGWLPWASPPVTIDPEHPAVVDGILRPGAVVTGRTVVAGGGRAAYVPLLVETTDGTPVASTQTGPQGGFRLQGFTRGTYRVSVAAGSAWAPSRTKFEVSDTDAAVDVTLEAVKGARVTLRAVEGGKRAVAAVDELRLHGRPYAVQLNRNGTIIYNGLGTGRYTVVVAGRHGYGLRSFRVTADGSTTDLGILSLDRPFLTIHGRSVPGANVEVTTGDLCPPGEEPHYGAFHEFARASADGRYAISGLVPGTYMVGADAYPDNYVPRCRSQVPVFRNTLVNIPLAEGEQVSGRLVYADNGEPVITTLSYELLYPPGSPTNPTDEHPARARTRAATGRFDILGLAPGNVAGQLATAADGDYTEAKFFVVHPYQDGTPYWLDAAQRQVAVGSSVGDLGDIPLTLHSGS